MGCQEKAGAAEAKPSSCVEENNTAQVFLLAGSLLNLFQSAASTLQKKSLEYMGGGRGKKNTVGRRKNTEYVDDGQQRIYISNAPSLPPNVIRSTKTAKKLDFGNSVAYKHCRQVTKN